MNYFISTMKQNEASSSFELAFAVYRSSFSHFRKKNINRVWKSRWSQFVESLGLGAIVLLFSSQAQSRERVGFSRKGKRFFLVPFEGNEGKPSLHGEMCATARTHLLGEKRATARPLLLQWSWMCEGAAYGKAVPSRLSHLRSVSWRQSLNCFVNFEKQKPSAAGTAASSHL